MKKIWLISALLLPLLAQAQYYYQDIYSTQQTNATFALYKKANVQKIIISSPNAGGQDFMAAKYISNDYRQMQTITQSVTTGKSTVTSLFDAQGRIIQSTDSSVNGMNITAYQYDEKGNIRQLALTASSPEIVNVFKFKETRTFYYDTSNHLVKMIRKKNEHDSSVVQFTTDENGNVTEEKETGEQAVYYKYNGQNELTDVVRYNNYSKRFLPDYMFDYNDFHQLVSMTTVMSGSTNYNVWKYNYNDQGLCIKETCYQQGKTLLGTVQYKYE